MASLERTLRKELEKTVKAARRVAEGGASIAIKQLGVGEAEAPRHLTADHRALRNRLRAHGRQLGDRRDPKTGGQATTRLVQECAYEHWHRMLFARFLAETDLLIEPDSGVAVTLDEVQELAREKETDWLPLASGYAERMLPQIFRKTDPVLEIALPPETRSELEDLLKGLPKPVFEADDSLGWVYQFWQSDRKDEVNKSEVKIGADELPAVTQLFTEDYMVLFLLHNTLGAWWAGKVLAGNLSLATSAPDEAALRAACKVGDIDWTYLRFVRDTAEGGTEGPWRPAAGTFEDWPKAAKDLTVLDPCMGSGHFLVFALPILVAFRMTEETLSLSAAVDAVLKDNLFGLEIDPRCTQIAAFNLAFATWRKVSYRPLPQLNLACSGLAIGVTKSEWLKLAERAVIAIDPAAKRDLFGAEQNLLTVGIEERVKNGLGALYDLFTKAPWLGSLIDPRRAGADIFREGFEKLEPLLAGVFAAAETDEAREMAVSAQGMAKAASLLAGTFSLVITNVPYLGLGKQDQVLREYCKTRHFNAKADLATCFIERCIQFLSGGGSTALVTPQSWMFLGTYREMRQSLLKTKSLDFAVKLGPGAFETISGEVVNVSLVSLTNTAPSKADSFYGIDVSSDTDTPAKATSLRTRNGISLLQNAQISNPDSRLILSEPAGGDLLMSLANSFEGIGCGDLVRFSRKHWEVQMPGRDWRVFRGTTDRTASGCGTESIIYWQDGKGDIFELAELLKDRLKNTWQRGSQAWGKRGVAINRMGDFGCEIYRGEIFDSNIAAVIPQNESDLLPIWAFAQTQEFRDHVRKLDQSIKITNITFLKVPFDIKRWRVVANEKYPTGLPVPESSDPRQIIFAGQPDSSASPLHVSVARLLGYKWPRQSGEQFCDSSIVEGTTLDNLADEDGIVCLTPLKGESSAEQRLNTLLASAFGSNWSAAKLAGLLNDTGCAGKSLDEWLRDVFFAQHCELFDQRPFIWHIWDGRRDGFHALINYHRLAAPNGEGRRTLEKLIYSYLGDWIDRQRADQTAGIEGADTRLTHAEHLKAELIKIMDGEPPYDIFVRWKPLREQSIGWDPDINDGVRMNIRPFMAARTLNARGANACILRATPKIRWDKDRGKEPNRDKADYPWFWGWDEATADFAGGATFDGNRWNDLHYTIAAKQAARDRHAVIAGGKK